MLAEGMKIIEAKEMLRDLKVSTFPNLKKGAKKDLVEPLKRVARKVEKENAPELPNSAIAEKLGLI